MAEGDPPPRVVWTRDGARWDEEMDPGADSSQRRNTLVTRYPPSIYTHIYAYLRRWCRPCCGSTPTTGGGVWPRRSTSCRWLDI